MQRDRDQGSGSHRVDVSVYFNVNSLRRAFNENCLLDTYALDLTRLNHLIVVQIHMFGLSCKRDSNLTYVNVICR